MARVALAGIKEALAFDIEARYDFFIPLWLANEVPLLTPKQLHVKKKKFFKKKIFISKKFFLINILRLSVN